MVLAPRCASVRWAPRKRSRIISRPSIAGRFISRIHRGWVVDDEAGRCCAVLAVARMPMAVAGLRVAPDHVEVPREPCEDVVACLPAIVPPVGNERDHADVGYERSAWVGGFGSLATTPLSLAIDLPFVRAAAPWRPMSNDRREATLNRSDRGRYRVPGRARILVGRARLSRVRGSLAPSYGSQPGRHAPGDGHQRPRRPAARTRSPSSQRKLVRRCPQGFYIECR